MIVQEENEAKKQMPAHKGLENFKLIEKMGEYVLISDICIRHCVSDYPPSGAFSNVYKAIDLKTGQKVAGKDLFHICWYMLLIPSQSRLFASTNSAHRRLALFSATAIVCYF